MQVILLERVQKLGQMGEVVTVKDGYARNFLLPQKKAMRATKASLEQFEKRRAQLEARNLEAKSEAEKLASQAEGRSVVVLRQASETALLYGSVSAKDIAEAFTADGLSLDRRQVALDQPLKTLGVHEVTVALHPEVEIKVSVNVARSQEEADIQAGKAVFVEEEPAENEGELLTGAFDVSQFDDL